MPSSDEDVDFSQRYALEEVLERVRRLSPLQVDVIGAIIERFTEPVYGGLERDDFLTPHAFDFFCVRLAAHHASSSNRLKKENFEHILAQSFNRAGVPTELAASMTIRGADLKVGELMLSLKTQSERGLRPNSITISKLMEAAWIKQVKSTSDIPAFIQSMVIPHFANYDRIFILRSYVDPVRANFVRYDLNEIPKLLLAKIGELTAASFRPLTSTRTTSASVTHDGVEAFKFRLDGSDDKLTITSLSTQLCPLHAWWSLKEPS